MKSKPLPPPMQLHFAMRRAMIMARQFQENPRHYATMKFDEDDSEWECLIQPKGYDPNDDDDGAAAKKKEARKK